MTTAAPTETEFDVTPILAERWSPRGYDAAFELSDADVAVLLEAARWSPSHSNSQPWKFVFARRGSADFDAVVEALAPGNRTWAGRASALVVAVVETERDGKALPWGLYDLGQSVAHLTVQASALGLATRQMAGFAADRIVSSFELPATLGPRAVIAVGRWSHADDVPEAVREFDELAPSRRSRKPLDEVLLRPVAGAALDVPDIDGR